MHVISRKKLREFSEKHPNSKAPLDEWWKIIDKGTFSSFSELRNVFPKADQVKVSDRSLTIFNIGGNNWRLIAAVHYNRQKIFILHVLTHADYDKEDWKK